MKYILQRKKIKRLILKINSKGEILISAPFWVSTLEIENFIEKNKEWIFRTKTKTLKRKIISTPFQENYFSGQILYLFGKQIEVSLKESQLSSFHLTEERFFVFYRKEEKKDLEQKIHDYLFQILHEFLTVEIEKFSKKLQLFPDFFKIKTMKSAWGIYHKRGNYISFNSLLLSKSKEFISYVVVHELCHIQYLNHQKEFWNLVRTEIPNYLEIRKSSRI